MDIFKFFPQITYNGKSSRNIISKSAFVKNVLERYKIYYPYTIKDGERPDTIAFDYYGQSSYEWLVCYPNNIIDIHSDWPKSYAEFYRYLNTSYGDINTTKTTVHHYKYTGINDTPASEIARKTWFITPYSWSKLSTEEKTGWEAVYLYDYEMELNERKRNIKLLSNEYLPQINREVRELYS
jgi:hypothetical protein